MDLISFHGDPAIKEKYLSRVKMHKELDHIVQGIGWEHDENGIRACAVGCTLESYNHSRYPIELGLPEWLAHLEDRIFEGLPKSDAMEWPEKFLSAIPIGKNLENVRHLIAIKRLNNLIEIQKNLREKNNNLTDIFNQTILSIEIVIRCHEAEMKKEYCDWSAAWSAARSAESAARSAATSAEESAWSAAWSAARSAARSAESAARSAATSAEESAESAATSAEESAESAAWSAAWSAARSAAWSAARSAARSAAWSAARSAARSAESAAWKLEAENLLEILSNA